MFYIVIRYNKRKRWKIKTVNKTCIYREDAKICSTNIFIKNVNANLQINKYSAKNIMVVLIYYLPR